MYKHILFSLSLFFIILTSWASEKNIHVSYVVDGDTFVTTENETVRLLGINTPEIDHHGQKSQPFSKRARQFLTEKITNKPLRLTFSEGRQKDRYGRYLAFAYLGTENINLSLINEGFAHVYTFPDTPFDATPFFKAELSTEKEKKNIWSIPRWARLKANDPTPKERIGTFQRTEGVVLRTKAVKDKIYLNFGPHWQTDFSIEIPKKYLENFNVQNIDPTTAYTGKKVLVRGFLKPINGTLVTVTHPEQIQLIP